MVEGSISYIDLDVPVAAINGEGDPLRSEVNWRVRIGDCGRRKAAAPVESSSARAPSRSAILKAVRVVERRRDSSSRSP